MASFWYIINERAAELTIHIKPTPAVISLQVLTLQTSVAALIPALERLRSTHADEVRFQPPLPPKKRETYTLKMTEMWKDLLALQRGINIHGLVVIIHSKPSIVLLLIS